MTWSFREYYFHCTNYITDRSCARCHCAGEPPSVRVDLDRITMLRDMRAMDEEQFASAATAFMHLLCAGAAACVQRAVRVNAPLGNDEQVR